MGGSSHVRTWGLGDEGWLEANRALWDERVPVHAASEFYGLEAFLADPTATALRPFELDEVGDVAGRRLVHLQCHFGLDTLSWARRGARATGLDFSGAAVATARDVAHRAGLAADFVAADVYDAPEALGGRTFDVVYTGLGALNWLPDVARWAGVVEALLAPGGFLYLAEFHPFAATFADDDLTVEHGYWPGGPLWSSGGGTYTDGEATLEHDRACEWEHGLGAVVSALLDRGLRLELLHEHDFTLFARWPFLVRADDGTYRMPDDRPSLPLMYSLRAAKPA